MQSILSTPMSSTISHSHRRNHSGELDVFEATSYFSGVADASNTSARWAMIGDGRSLDVPMDAKVPQPHQKVEHVDRNMVKEKVRCKQPSSPAGGKLVSFLSNFFKQYSNSMKSMRSSSSSPKPVKSDQEEGNISRRTRSSRMSSTIHHVSKSCHYSSSCSSISGFRTPSVNNNSKKRVSAEGFKDNNEDSIVGDEFTLKMRLGDELKIKEEEKIEFRDLGVGDDGGESDSSSDLFELKIDREFGEVNSSGLPIYGSTDVGVIRSRERFASTVAY